MTKLLILALFLVTLMLGSSLYSIYEEHCPIAEDGQCILIHKSNFDLIIVVKEHSHVTGTIDGIAVIKKFGVYYSNAIVLKDIQYSEIRSTQYQVGDCVKLGNNL